MAGATLVVGILLLAGPGAAVAATVCECGSCSCGGATGPLELMLIGSAPSNVGGMTACITSDVECPSGPSGGFTEPLTNPTPSLYSDSFLMEATGGSGTYTYDWSCSGSSPEPDAPSTTCEFTTFGTQGMQGMVVSGSSHIEFTITISVVLGPLPTGSAVTYSSGNLGWGLSLNEPVTKYVEIVMKAGEVASDVTDLLCQATGVGEPECTAVATTVSVILYAYGEWATDVDQGNGVCFEEPFGGPWVVVANPCSPGY